MLIDVVYGKRIYIDLLSSPSSIASLDLSFYHTNYENHLEIAS